MRVLILEMAYNLKVKLYKITIFDKSIKTLALLANCTSLEVQGACFKYVPFKALHTYIP